MTFFCLSLLAGVVGQSQPMEQIYPSTRVFTARDLQAAIEDNSNISELAKQLSKDPKRLSSLIKLAGELQKKDGQPDLSKLDPSIRQFAEKIAKSPDLQKRFFSNPAIQKIAKDSGQQIPRMGAEPRPQTPASSLGKQGDKDERKSILPARDFGKNENDRAESDKAANNAIITMTKSIRSVGGPLKNSPTLERTISQLNRVPVKDWIPKDLSSAATNHLPKFLEAIGSGGTKNSEQSSFAQVNWFRKIVPTQPQWTNMVANLPSFGSATSRLPSMNGAVDMDSAPSVSGQLFGLLLCVLLGTAMIFVGIMIWLHVGSGSLSRVSVSSEWPKHDATARGMIMARFEAWAKNWLGDSARAMNHWSIVRRVMEKGKKEEMRDDLWRFGQLYELARYAPPSYTLEEDALSSTEQISHVWNANV